MNNYFGKKTVSTIMIIVFIFATLLIPGAEMMK